MRAVASQGPRRQLTCPALEQSESCAQDCGFGRDMGLPALSASILQALELQRLREEGAEATRVPVWLHGAVCSK